MNTTELRAFHRVASAGSFSAAGRNAGVSQPTLSAQVRALEAAQGVRLFNRHGRWVSLTPIGQSLFAITTRLFMAEEEARDLLADVAALRRGQLSVAADHPGHVMPLLARLRARHAGLVFSLRIGNSAEVVQSVLEFAAEVGVTARLTSDPRVHSVPIRHDRLVVFVPAGHAWAARGKVRLGEIAGQELVLREHGSITREVFEARLVEQDVRPSRLFEVATREAVREAVLAGFGIGVVFESELGTEAGASALEITDADLGVTEYLICLEERRRLPLVREFLEVAGERA
ncbi:MAG: LysR substrate-binding domain-containing protein [Rhodospirillales bacterium]|nr:LysR substrate-binding domain-containing protein [Rhodospirillales bacterium]